MPRVIRPFLRKVFHRPDRPDRPDNANDREGSRDGEQGVASSYRKDSTEVSAASIDISHPTKISAATTTSASQLPAARATGSTKTETSTDTDGVTASLPVRLWDRAYNDLKREETDLVDVYEKILSRQLQDGLGSVVPESQPNTIAQNNSDARRHQMTQLIHAGLDKIAREATVKEGLGVAVDVVLSARNIINLAIQAVPQAALAWTGICLTLELLANPVKATEANRKGIDYVVKRMDWYWSLSGNLLKDLPDHADMLSGVRHELENQVVDLYKVLLSYQVKSVCSYYRNRGLVLLRDVIKLDNWDADLEGIRDAEKCFRDDTQTYNAQQVTSHLEQLVSHARNQEMQQMSEKDQQCLKHLRLTNPRDDKARIERTKGGLLQDSYRWVLDNPDFRQWRDRPESRLLWIKGDPGKSKTMLLCGIINELDCDNSANVWRRNVAYFFCQATDSRINHATAVLRGLIYLLIDQQPSLLSHMRSEYDRAGEGLFQDANTWDALSRIFANILRDPNLQKTYLVIDALDECVTDLPQLLDLIAQGSSGSSQVKWIVSSRNWPQIEERLETATNKDKLLLERNAESVAVAINAFIRHKVGQLAPLKNYDTATRDTVQDYLCSHAQDTFLWVALVCQALADLNVRKRHTLQKLRTFPPGLDSLYARMIEHIRDSEDADLCKQILAVATIVRRPISLDELTSLVEIPDDVSDDPGSLEEIVKLCGSFLTLRDQTVYFVHQSAKDFLLSKASDKASNKASQEAFGWVFPSGTESVDHVIFSRSLNAMSTALRRDMYGLGAPGFPIGSIRVPDPDPLTTVLYSCVYWVDHLYASVSGPKIHRDDLLQDDGVVHTFLKAKYLYWLEALSLLRAMPEGVTAISQLKGLLERIDRRQLTDLVWDAHRFALAYRWIIEQAPLQAYASALVFAPAGSLIKKCFNAEEPDWIKTKPVVEVDWNTCLQTLEGHGGWVQSVAFSPDGQRLAFGLDDDTVKIWDAASGRCIQTLEGGGGSVTFSPNGQRLASGSGDNTIKIWDTASGHYIQILEGHSSTVWSVAFSPNDQWLASSSEDNTVKIWDTTSGYCIQTLEGYSRSVAFSPDGQQIASGSSDNTIKIWDTASGRYVQTLEGHSSLVGSVAFSANGQRLASGSHDNTVKIWDTTLGHCIQTLEGHSSVVYSVAFSPNNQQVASGSIDNTVKIWDTVSGRCLQTLEGHNNAVISVAFSFDGQQVVSGSFDNTIKIWDTASERYIQTLEGHSNWVTSIVFSPNGQWLASGSQDNTVKIWDTTLGHCIQTLEGHGRSVYSVAFSPNNQQVASGSSDDTVKIWDTVSGRCVQTLEGHNNTVISVAFSFDGQQVVSGSFDKTIKIWNAISGRCVQRIDVGAPIRRISFDQIDPLLTYRYWTHSDSNSSNH